jgi:hypothetical protein
MRPERWIGVALMTVAFTVIAVGVVMAAPGTSEQAFGDLNQAVVNSTLSTTMITPTSSFTHPVGLAISQFFSVTYTQVMSMHQSGLGFGEIARVYMLAQSSGKTPAEVLAMRESGMGWGQIMKELGFKPGGNNLGAIMSGRGVKDKEPHPGKPDKPVNSNRPDCPGKSCDSPGKGKPKK